MRPAGIAELMGHRGYLVQRPELRPGDPVEVRHGPFSGLLGVVEAPSTARERVRVLLDLVRPFDLRGAGGEGPHSIRAPLLTPAVVDNVRARREGSHENGGTWTETAMIF